MFAYLIFCTDHPLNSKEFLGAYRTESAAIKAITSLVGIEKFNRVSDYLWVVYTNNEEIVEFYKSISIHRTLLQE